jgi:putative aminopeptidase FrvX
LNNPSISTILTCFMILSRTFPLLGQISPQQNALASWVQLDMPTGYETRISPHIAIEMNGWASDQWGNLTMTVGSGGTKTVVACGLDRPSYSVSQITKDGYLRVHRIGRGSSHPLWDQAHEAQTVRILTQNGPVAGVVARSNGHFNQQHSEETNIVTADDLWVDVGVETQEQVAALGIELLDPLSRHLPRWSYNGHVAGPDAGARSGCATVATLAQHLKNNPPTSSETINFVLSSQKEFGWIGLSSFLSRQINVDKLIILGDGESKRIHEIRPNSSFGRLEPILVHSGIAQVDWISPTVREIGSHMESISMNESDWLLTQAAALLGKPLKGYPAWIEAPKTSSFLNDSHDPAHQNSSALLETFANAYGVSGHEWSVRRQLLEALPKWARDQAKVDDIGNIILEMGPENDTTVFMAHLDEVGYEVGAIDPEGIVTLERKGGAVSSAWEGQTALLHFDPLESPNTKTGTGSDYNPKWKKQSVTASAIKPIKGIFLTRENPQQKNPEQMQAWFGMNRSELKNLGVQKGMAVSSYKEALRIGSSRFVARSLDDRAGSTALLMAINNIDPDELSKKIYFVWSVHEESGHIGALALSKLIGLGTRRIYSVDTFVSSDTPLESPHFAHALLGKGPVLRAIETSGASPVAERDIVINVANTVGIPLQIGLTQGSTDGVDFAFWGAPNQGLSWPGRYSHSPGEVLDLRDLENLAKLVRNVVLSEEP